MPEIMNVDLSTGETVVEAYVPVQIPLTKADLVTYAADARWRAETGGFELGGMSIASDDRSKTMILGARVKAEGDAAFTTRWKGPDGVFATIDAATIKLISDAVLQHVADCFSAEDTVITGIYAGEVTTTQQVDSLIAAAISQNQAARAPNSSLS
ncbi:DUF4376 domain-containing protein [Agrobacterium sp. CG674]